jgi:hypothetical protein
MAELPRGVIDAALFNKYSAAIVNGQSRSAVYNSTIGTDLGIRKTDSLAISRQAEIQANTILSFRELPQSQPIQPDYMLEMNAAGEKKYMYTIEATIVTTYGTTLEQQYIPIYSDSILTKEDIKQMAEDMNETKGGTEINVTTGDVTEAYRNTA